MSTTVQRALVGAVIVIAALLLIKSVTETQSSSPAAAPVAQAPAPAVGTIVLPTQVSGALLQPEVAPPDPSASWNPVVELSGSDSLRSAPFQLNGGTVKINYNLALSAGNAAALLAVYLVPEGQSPNQSGFPDALAMAAGDGEKLLSRPPGSYVLNIQTIGGSWTIGVEEVAG